MSDAKPGKGDGSPARGPKAAEIRRMIRDYPYWRCSRCHSVDCVPVKPPEHEPPDPDRSHVQGIAPAYLFE